MSYIADRNAHLDRMQTSIIDAKIGFFGSNRTRAHQLAIIEGLINSFTAGVAGLVEEATGDADYMAGHAERMIDDARLCFTDAEGREPVPVSRQAPYGVAYDRARGA